MIVLFAMLLFNVLTLRKNGNFGLSFLLKFQIALAAFFSFGLLLRWFELYPLLRLMPMRLFPVFTPLFFIFTAFRIVPRISERKYKIGAAAFAVLLIALLNPFWKGFNQVKETWQTYQISADDLHLTSRWIAANTPLDAQIIHPPHRRDLWYFSRRANIVSFGYPTFNRLDEWRERLNDLTGNQRITSGERAAEEIENAYNRLSAEQIGAIQRKYAANYLVSRADYPFAIVFQTETYKIYRLP